MDKMARMLLLGLLCSQAVLMKNIHAQGVDTPPSAEAGKALAEAQPAVSPKPQRRTGIPFPSQCGHFKKQVQVNRQQPLKAKADFILVSKSLRRLVLFKGETPLKAYNINLGFAPIGHKVQEGDGKTPEGQYFIEFKNWNSQFRRSLKVSYPNARDKAKARSLEVSPGGDIMIHGEHYDEDKRIAIREYLKEKGRADWTHGCMAVTDSEIDEIYAHVDLKTFVEICP